MAKTKNINLSQAFEAFLGLNTEIAERKVTRTDKEEIQVLTKKLAIISAELKQKNEEIEKLKKEKPTNSKNIIRRPLMIGGEY